MALLTNVSDITNVANPSPTSQTYHQHEVFTISTSSIDVANYDFIVTDFENEKFNILYV